MKFMTFRADGLALRPLAAALVALTIGGNVVAQDLVLEEVTVTAKKTEVKFAGCGNCCLSYFRVGF
ncbi:MAG: hypothetical protein CM15mP25_0140 [Gammaproteobacteria bacterium]|nr:MAG: hypothetical protein CM15mP25_0140 [Gammaproteobacteria bacterium]